MKYTKDFDNILKHVMLFNQKFGLPVGVSGKVDCSKDNQRLMFDLLIEEVVEFKDAFESDNKVEIVDALGDILFVVLSAAISHGLHEDDVFVNSIHEICRSNLTKDKAKRYNEGEKRSKGDNYEPPRIREILYNKLRITQ